MVAIINHGRLVAEAPVEELLNGSNRHNTVFVVTLKGDARPAQARVNGQPWVQSLSSAQEGDLTTWQVSVNDEDAAEDQMLPIVLEGHDVRVKSFGRKKQNLEEVFLSLVKEEKSK